VRFTIVVFLLAILVACLAAGGAWALDRNNNPYGIVTFFPPSFDSTGASQHAQLARDLVGEWGYVRQGMPLADPAAMRRLFIILRAKHLIPICEGGRPDPQYQDDRGWPIADEDGTYTTAAKSVGDQIASLVRRDIRMPYLEVFNEVNNTDWPAVNYARYLRDVSIAVKQADPSIKIVSCGMAGSGADYYERMLDAVPELKQHVDFWGLHPYGANHPPSYEDDDVCLRAYDWTAKALRQGGVGGMRFMCTESGYELGDQRDTRFPRITEELRADYITEAYTKYWAPDTRVQAVTCFSLWDQPGNAWSGWDWVRYDGSLTPVYKAVAALPKPKGQDWMTAGQCGIRGQVTDRVLKIPVAHAFVYTRPGLYAAESDDEGNYYIADIPQGRYMVAAFNDRYSPARERLVILGEREIKTANIDMLRVGVLSANMETAGGAGGQPSLAAGWQTPDGKDHPEWARLATDLAHGGAASQAIGAGGAGIGDRMIWLAANNLSVEPGKTYSGEVWVSTVGLRKGKGEGAGIRLQFADIWGAALAEGVVVSDGEGDTGWHVLTVTMQAPTGARRLRVELFVDADAGAVFFDDLFVDIATLPLPSDYARLSERGTGTIAGQVTDPSGRAAAGVTVSLYPFNRWQVTDATGFYQFDQLPEGFYRVRGFSPDWASTIAPPQWLGAGGSETVNLVMRPLPAPRQLANPGFEDYGGQPSYLGGWHRWGSVDGIMTSGDYLFGITAHGGDHFFASGAGSNTKNGGIYQTIEVTAGSEYEVSAWYQTRQVGGEPLDDASRIGADPTGGIDPKADSVHWTTWAASEAKWSPISLKVKAKANRLTVFLEHRQRQGNTWNVNCFDDVSVAAK
jgi:hypothetical protein